MADLEALTKRSADQIPSVVLVVPSQNERFDARAFADIASRLSARVGAVDHGSGVAAPGWRHHLDQAFRAYCVHRSLSPRQERVLALYLSGSNDKEMADAFGCSEATVYEHWRRMAKKASGFHKWDVVTDFHRFLAGSGGNEVVPDGPKVDGPKAEAPRASGAKRPLGAASSFATRRNG
ncbi:MAG TPA: LuxR C-terminal-related transcriptional regulator [Polyangia bacterium]